MSLTDWDFVLSGLFLIFFMALAWLLLAPHGEPWVPDELRPDSDEHLSSG